MPRFTSFFNYLAILCRRFFTTVGMIFAKVSSYLTWIDLNEFGQTVYELCSSIVNFIMSWTYVCNGYEMALRVYHNPALVQIGSGILIACIGLAFYYKYEWVAPIFNQWVLSLRSKLSYFRT
jgi:hypothetical protein